MSDPTTSDEVIDAIASIELHRQEMEKEAGLEASRSFALRKLQEFLQGEQEASQLAGPDRERHLANVKALTTEFKRIKSLAAARSQHQRPASQRTHSPQPQGPRQGGQPSPSRSRGRRTMGRRPVR